MSGRSVIVFVVQPGEVNSVDQRLLEHQLWHNHSIRVMRKTLKEMRDECILRDDHTLVLERDQVDGAVVYFRAGYTPDDYPSEHEWEGRSTIEYSRAIKCPSIAYHLVGTKKVQQQFAREGALDKSTSVDQPLDLPNLSRLGLTSGLLRALTTIFVDELHSSKCIRNNASLAKQ